jgi:hypothetical protein
MALFVLQILHGNSAMTHLRLLSGISCTQGSYCDARQRLPVAGVAALVEHLYCDAVRCNQSASWEGRRVLMTDATTATASQWVRYAVSKLNCRRRTRER